MKSFTVFLILALIIVSVGLAGCIGGELPGTAMTTVPTTQVTTTVVVVVPVTTAAIPETSVLHTAPTTTRVIATPTLTSADDIRNHFLNVAYTSTNRLERLNYSTTKPRVIISAVSASNEDISFLEKTARDFNEASSTVKLSENVKETGTGDLFIKFLTKDGLSAVNLFEVPESGPFPEVLTRGELYQGGAPAAKIVRGTIYINTDLKGDARNHILIKSLMYEMGLTGESALFSDSVFFAGENTNVDLTSADKKIITMLYAQGFANGMTMEDLKKVIYLP